MILRRLGELDGMEQRVQGNTAWLHAYAMDEAQYCLNIRKTSIYRRKTTIPFGSCSNQVRVVVPLEVSCSAKFFPALHSQFWFR